jgi:hypothetical protein
MRLVAVERPSPLGNKIPIGLLMERGPKLDEFMKAHGLLETHP